MQGFNMGRYVPPEFEGTKSANQLAGKHALGQRASKLKSDGILTVRFEMPFAVWCGHCPKPTIIGQGVRFNAEKKKIGNYLSTPVFSFRMKHAACGGAIEIRTDPKNTAYVVYEGGKARDYGEDRVRPGEEGVPILSAEERERRREDAFAALEGKKEDKALEKENGKRIRELQEARERDWEDPYEASKRLRRTFRQERKVIEKDQKHVEDLQDRMGLAIELVPENEEDRIRAGMVEFGQLGHGDPARKALSKPLFSTGNGTTTTGLAQKPKGMTKKAWAVEQQRVTFKQSLRDNTRAVVDPFGKPKSATETSTLRPFALVKRKRPTEGAHDNALAELEAESSSSSPAVTEQIPADSQHATVLPGLDVYDDSDD